MKKFDVIDDFGTNSVYDERDDGFLTDTTHSSTSRFEEEDWTEETRSPTYLRIEERIFHETNDTQVAISCVDGEKFDTRIAADSLRTYHRKLQMKKEEAKAKERDKTLIRLGLPQSPGSIKRYEFLYKIGKSIIIFKKEKPYLNVSNTTSSSRKLKEKSTPLNQICNRLYDESVTMQIVNPLDTYGIQT